LDREEAKGCSFLNSFIFAIKKLLFITSSFLKKATQQQQQQLQQQQQQQRKFKCYEKNGGI